MTVTSLADMAAASFRIEALHTRRLDLADDLLDRAEIAKLKKARGHTAFKRKRVQAGSVRVDFDGLANSLSYNRSARAQNDRDCGYLTTAPEGDDYRGPVRERALMVQPRADTLAVLQYAQALPAPGLQAPFTHDGNCLPGDWGEDITAGGPNDFNSQHVCIGDEYELASKGGAPVRLQVASPRRPCARLDERHGKSFSARGVRAHCARTGLGGIFMRVLVPGALRAGDTLRLVSRPHPGWTISRVSWLLHGHDDAVMRYISRGVTRDEWMGTEAELRELAALPALAVMEYKEELVRMLPELSPIGLYAKQRQRAGHKAEGVGTEAQRQRTARRGGGGALALFACASIASALLIRAVAHR
jgi:hypothetical protein